jgi:hypothetical protein
LPGAQPTQGVSVEVNAKPALQKRHCVDPLTSVYVPSAQTWHALEEVWESPASENLPGAQALHSVEACEL